MHPPKRNKVLATCGMCGKDDKVTFQHVSNTWICNRCGLRWENELPPPQPRPNLRFGWRGSRIWRKRQAGTVRLIPADKEDKPITATEILARRKEKEQEIFGTDAFKQGTIDSSKLKDFAMMDEMDDWRVGKPSDIVTDLKGFWDKLKQKDKCKHARIKCNWTRSHSEFGWTMAVTLLCDDCSQDVTKEYSPVIEDLGRSQQGRFVVRAKLNNGLTFTTAFAEEMMR